MTPLEQRGSREADRRLRFAHYRDSTQLGNSADSGRTDLGGSSVWRFDGRTELSAAALLVHDLAPGPTLNARRPAPEEAGLVFRPSLALGAACILMTTLVACTSAPTQTASTPPPSSATVPAETSAAPVAVGPHFATGDVSVDGEPGYHYTLSADVTIGPAVSSIETSPPGRAKVTVPFHGEVALRNATSGRQADAGGLDRPYAVALWPSPSPLCTAVRSRGIIGLAKLTLTTPSGDYCSFLFGIENPESRASGSSGAPMSVGATRTWSLDRSSFFLDVPEEDAAGVVAALATEPAAWVLLKGSTGADVVSKTPRVFCGDETAARPKGPVLWSSSPVRC
jgi:hypothetical protein